MKTLRIKIARQIDGFVQYMTYIGPLDQTPAGWSIVFRKVVSGMVR